MINYMYDILVEKFSCWTRNIFAPNQVITGDDDDLQTFSGG